MTTNIKKAAFRVLVNFLPVFILLACAAQPAKAPEPVTGRKEVNRKIIEESQAKIIYGLEHYEIGDYEQTRNYFNDALTNLQKADLPEAMKTLDLLELNLPKEYREKYSLQTVYEDAKRQHPEESGLITEGESGASITAKEPGQEAVVASVEPDRVPPGIPFSKKGIYAREEDKFVREQILLLLQEFGEDQPNKEEIDNLVKEVKENIYTYQTIKRKVFIRSLIRGQKYFPMINEIFAAKNVPLDLANVALVESAFVYRAHSRAAALGIWQFMAATGRNYGLRVNRSMDERLDPVRSTIAAREYLLDLIGIFGSRSFMLALASYNAGEGKVQKCLRGLENPFEDRTFWHINKCLRQETRDYIPQILAVIIIQKDLERFGFTDIEFPDADVFICREPISIEEIAQVCEVPVETIYALNEDLPTSYRRTPISNFILYVPPDTLDKLNAKYPPLDLRTVTLASLGTCRASAYESINDAQGQNNGEDNNNAPGNGETYIYHKVRHKETLYRVAKRYNVSVAQLRKWNGLKSNSVKSGQRLRVYGKDIDIAEAKPVPAAQKQHRILYKVKKGNTLYQIAELFDVQTRDIRRWNKLSGSRIRVGRNLIIYPPKPFRIVKHRVESGETVNSIAKKYHVQSGHLVIANGLDPRRAYPKTKQLLVYKSSN